MPRDKRGWRVAPAPDGRGTPAQPPPTPPHRLRGFWIFVLVLLGAQLAVGARRPARQRQPRVTVPFSPYFLNQVQAGEVKSISSKGDTIQGTFTSKMRYPADDKTRRRRRCSRREVPTFWNNR